MRVLTLLLLSISGAVAFGRSAAPSAKAHLSRGLERYERGNPEEAIVEYDAAIAIDPRFPQAHNYLRGARRAHRERTGVRLADPAP